MPASARLIMYPPAMQTGEQAYFADFYQRIVQPTNSAVSPFGKREASHVR